MNQKISENPNDSTIIENKKFFIDSVFQICQSSFINDQNRTSAYFIGLLIQNGHISIEFASTFLKLIEEPIQSKNAAAGFVYFLFGCCRKLNEENPLLMNQFFELLDSKITSFQQPAFSLLQELKEIHKNDFEMIRNLNYETKLPILSHAIQFDDVDFVQNFFANPKNDINMNYPTTLFEPWYQKNEEKPISTICAAALYGSVKCFKYLLLNGAEIGDCRSCAIDGGNIEIIRIVEQKTPFEISSLFQAVEFHRYEAFIWLFESKVLVFDEENQNRSEEEIVSFKMPKLKNGKTLLHSAAISNSIRCCIFILDRSLNDINAADKLGFTPIMRAVMNGSIDVAQILMNTNGIDLTKRTAKSNNTLLHLAAMKDDAEMVNLFLPFYDVNSVNLSNQTPIFTASASKAIHCVRLFIQCPKIDLSIREKHSNMNCFLISVSSRSLDCAISLFETGFFDINDVQKSTSALSIAASNGDFEMMKFILSVKNIDVNKDGLSLFKAIDSGNIECVKILLNNPDIKVNILNRTKETPLLHACNLLDDKKYEDIVKILVNHKGIKLNCRDNFGRTPLLVAAAYESIEIVSFLLKTKGVKINAVEKVFFF